MMMLSLLTGLPRNQGSSHALAYLVDRLIEEGKLIDYADAARRLGISRGRMTQVMNLKETSPTIQEGILVSGWELSERWVRGIGVIMIVVKFLLH